MPQQRYTKKITRDLRPSYYDKFLCLAGACRTSCCKNWRVTFDKKDYLALKQLDGSAELNQMISHGLHRLHKNDVVGNFYAEFSMNNGVCPLLRKDCLCELQIEKGHDALPLVCQIFPRGESYLYSGYLERSLSLGCEAVLLLLWDEPGGVTFFSDPLPETECRTLAFDDPCGLGAYFQDIRSWCIDILQNRNYPLPERILRVGAGLKLLADGETDIPKWLHTVCAYAEQQNSLFAGAAEQDRILSMFLSNNLRLLLSLTDKYDPSTKSMQQAVMDAFGINTEGAAATKIGVPYAPWLSARSRFEERFNGRDYFLENIAVSLFYYLHLPDVGAPESIWKSYVNFCNLYSFCRFLAVMSCHDRSPADRETLMQYTVFACRTLLHNGLRQQTLRDEFFEHDSATLAHMAVLLSG